MTTKTLEEIQAGPITTPDPTLTLTMPAKPLNVGSHTFQLIVEDDSGNVSQPAKVLLVVIDTQAPTAVLLATDANGRPLAENRIPFGEGFILNASRSTDIGGQIVKYTWSLEA